ncbi:MAG: hypothetical protein ABSF45_31225 [Terriglobia bacterium]
MPVIVAVVILSIVFLLTELEKDRASILFSGISRFYHSFPQELNQGVFKQVQSKYCYVGITFSSVLNAFRVWCESELKGNVRLSNLQGVAREPLTDDGMKEIAGLGENCRLIKGQVLLWKEGQTWEDLWDLNGEITPP